MRPAAAVLVASLSLASTARAQVAATRPLEPLPDKPLSGAITFAAGATCLEESRVEAQVQAWLGRDRIAADVRVDVRGSDHDPRAVSFRITHGGKSHDRRFDHLPEECDDATAVLGLAVALAIDASVLAGVFAPPPPAPPPRRLVSVELGVGMEVVPGTSAGAEVGLEYGLADWLSGRLDVGSQFSSGNAIQDTSGTFDAALGYASPQVCAGGAVAEGVRLELCSGAAVGLVHAQGHGYAQSRSATGPWLVAQGGVRLVATTGFSWVLDAEGVFPLHVPEFRAESAQGQAELRQVNPAGALLSIGPVFFF